MVNALKGNAINFVGTSNQKETRAELLKEDNSSSSEATGEENKDLAGLNAGSKLGSLRLFSSGGA